MKPTKLLRASIPFISVAAVLGGAYLWFGRLAPTPPIFDESVTIEQASAAAGPDEVVLAVVTADFCPTCQIYKRNALSSEALVDWVRGRAETVYLEWERDADTIEALGVEKWPATLVLSPAGQVIAREYGMMSEDGLMAFLNDAASRAGGDGAPSETTADADGRGAI